MKWIKPEQKQSTKKKLVSKANIKSRLSYYCLSKQEYRQFLQSSIDVKTSQKQDVAYKGKIKDCQSTRKLNVNNT